MSDGDLEDNKVELNESQVDRTSEEGMGRSRLPGWLKDLYYIVSYLKWAAAALAGLILFLIRVLGQKESVEPSMLQATIVASWGSLGIAAVAAIVLVKKRLPKNPRSTNIAQFLNKIIKTAYLNNNLTAVIIFQFSLRVLFILIVLGVMRQRIYGDGLHETFDDGRNLVASIRIYSLSLYLLFATVFVTFGFIKCNRAAAENDLSLLTGTLTMPAIVDCFFVLAISALSWNVGESTYLAYAIPLSCVWLLKRKNIGAILVFVILLFTTVGFSISLCLAYHFDPEMKAKVDLMQFPYWPLLQTQLVPALVFWLAISVPIAALRMLHNTEMVNREKADIDLGTLEIVTRHLGFSVFMKDKNRCSNM